MNMNLVNVIEIKMANQAVCDYLVFQHLQDVADDSSSGLCIDI